MSNKEELYIKCVTCKGTGNCPTAKFIPRMCLDCNAHGFLRYVPPPQVLQDAEEIESFLYEHHQELYTGVEDLYLKMIVKAMQQYAAQQRGEEQKRKCTDCGTRFASRGRCPECNPMG